MRIRIHTTALLVRNETTKSQQLFGKVFWLGDIILENVLEALLLFDNALRLLNFTT